jgi:hypothetical protein
LVLRLESRHCYEAAMQVWTDRRTLISYIAPHHVAAHDIAAYDIAA